jgi:hypothetical protein
LDAHEATIHDPCSFFRNLSGHVSGAFRGMHAPDEEEQDMELSDVPECEGAWDQVEAVVVVAGCFGGS